MNKICDKANECWSRRCKHAEPHEDTGTCKKGCSKITGAACAQTTLTDPAHHEIGERLMDAATAHALACIELGKSKEQTLKEGHAIYDRAVNGLEFKS